MKCGNTLCWRNSSHQKRKRPDDQFQCMKKKPLLPLKPTADELLFCDCPHFIGFKPGDKAMEKEFHETYPEYKLWIMERVGNAQNKMLGWLYAR